MTATADESAKTPVSVSGQMLTLPKWLVEVATPSGFEKANDLVKAYRKITRFHVANANIVANVKGSKGDTYLVKVSIWNKENGEEPKLITCSCPHGVLGKKGICYHKVALILKVLSLPAMPYSNPIPKYEDNFNLD